MYSVSIIRVSTWRILSHRIVLFLPSLSWEDLIKAYFNTWSLSISLKVRETKRSFRRVESWSINLMVIPRTNMWSMPKR